MAQPSSFVLQHNSVNQLNDVYYNTNIPSKYLGYRYKFVNSLKVIIFFLLKKKYNLRNKLMLAKNFLFWQKLLKPLNKLVKRIPKYKIFISDWYSTIKRFKSNLEIPLLQQTLTFFKDLVYKKSYLKKLRNKKFNWKFKKKKTKLTLKKKYFFYFAIMRFFRFKEISLIYFISTKLVRKRFKKKAKLHKIKRLHPLVFLTK